MPSPFFGIPDAEYGQYVAIVNTAINSWRNLVVTVAAENVAMGITQSGKTQLIADTFEQVMFYGQTGSLYEAYIALGKIKPTPEMAPFVTDARITWMRNQIMLVIRSLS